MQLFQRQDAERRLHEIQKKDDDIRKLTEERDNERRIRRNRDKEIERLQSVLKEQHLHTASSIDRRNQDTARQVTHIFY